MGAFVHMNLRRYPSVIKIHMKVDTGLFVLGWWVLDVGEETVDEDEDEVEDVEGVYVGSSAFFRECVNIQKEIFQ